jgi:protein-disulfide isomerase
MNRLPLALATAVFAFQPLLASAMTSDMSDSMPLPPDTQWIGARLDATSASSSQTVFVRPTWAASSVSSASSMVTASHTIINRPSPRTLHLMYWQQEQLRAQQHGLMLQASSASSVSSDSWSSSSASSLSHYMPVGDLIPALPLDAYSVGSASAPVTVVDYGCPSCAIFATTTMTSVTKNYIQTGKVRFVFRNFPLSYHPAANVAAMAIECSRDQSADYALSLQTAFFAATAKNNDLTQDDIYGAIAHLKGVDTEKLYYCIDTSAKQSVLDRDEVDAIAGGVNGTPSFWILGKNGKSELVQGALDDASFKKVLDNFLK